MNPVFTHEGDFVRFWKDVPDVSSVSFQDSVDEIYQHSYVCKSFRCEFEVESTFTKKGLKSVKDGDVKLDEKQKLAIDMKVPGFTLKSYIPQQSCFKTSDMVELFNITLLMSQGKELTHEQQKMLAEHSQALQNEQASYQNFAMNQWMHFAMNKHSQITPEVMKYVNKFWKLKLERVREYPKYFSNVMSIPLKDNDLNANYRGTFTYINTVAHIGKRTAKYSFPHLRMFLVKAQDVFEKMNNDLDALASDNTSTKHGWPQYKTVYKNLLYAQYHPEVSKDKKAESIAYNSDVQIVMSASAFCALINHSGHESSWDIFVLVKEVERETGVKKIVFLDKKLPPKAMTIVDRQKFFMKKAIKRLLVKPATEMRAQFPKMYDCTELETFGIDSGSNNSINPQPSENTCLSTAVEDDFETDQSVHSDDLCIETDKEDNECGKDTESYNSDNMVDGNQNKKRKEINEKSSVSSHNGKNENRTTNFIINYNLWEMKACHEENVLSKKTRLKDLKLLVRVSHEGRGTFAYSKMGRFKLSAKLEYQPEYGAESVTLEESLKDWSSILLRPNTMLGRGILLFQLEWIR
ncbi:uncharacterized protein LOC106668521 isoform X2 [Cimex lectularius]|uniref:Little elongation complex subunit 2 C-terminal domain-containing protein n=1 Tax=Cimex lectularius TaxID=79782 RepID=A0A8I6RV11_CIMLE|nr:uncharacterized protein LOC106668521 isoform X2 [Cimex lectularius]